MSDDKLQSLREELGGVDQDILRLAARRRELALEIGRVKERSQKGTRDYGQEKVVIERACRAAEALGLPEGLAENLMRELIRSSLSVQEQQRVIAEGEGSGQRVLIIGGAGKMGRWFATFLSSQGYGVEIADPAGPVADFPHFGRWQDAPPGHDIVIVATPLGHSQTVLQQLLENPPTGIVFDVGSLKSPLTKGLQDLRDAGVKVTSVHPMFGPDVGLLSGKHVVFCDVGVPEATAKAWGLFEATMADRVEMSLEEHDRLIAYVLGLSHAVNIAFFTALSNSAEEVPRLARMSSTTFDSQLAVASNVAGENPHLYYEIQALNSYGKESLEALSTAVENLKTFVVDGDEDAFVAMMSAGNAYLGSRTK